MNQQGKQTPVQEDTPGSGWSMHGYILEPDKEKKKRRIMNGPRRQTNHRKSVSQWIVTSCQPHRVRVPGSSRGTQSHILSSSSERQKLSWLWIFSRGETHLCIRRNTIISAPRLRPDRPTDDSNGAGAMDLSLHTAPAWKANWWQWWCWCPCTDIYI